MLSREEPVILGGSTGGFRSGAAVGVVLHPLLVVFRQDVDHMTDQELPQSTWRKKTCNIYIYNNICSLRGVYIMHML